MFLDEVAAEYKELKLRPQGVFDIQNIYEYTTQNIAHEFTSGMPAAVQNHNAYCWLPPFQKTWVEYVSSSAKNEYASPSTKNHGAYIEFNKENNSLKILLFGKSGSLFSVHECFHLFLDDSGNIQKVETYVWNPFKRTVENSGDSTEWWNKPKDFYNNTLINVVYFLNFYHCQNVTTKTTSLSKKERSARRVKGRVYFEKTYILVIELMKRVLETEGSIKTTGIRHAFHICRGHFKTYTEDKPLFGRVTGTFFWHGHVRGDDKVGRINKTYEVKA